MTTRIGLIVPSSNVTMETELPQLLGRLELRDVDFAFHSSRVRMKSVTQDELSAMVDASSAAAAQLADVRPDIVAYACLVAIMSQGNEFHRRAEEELEETLRANGSCASVISSAGALIGGIKALGAQRVAVLTPYMKPLTTKVVDYIEASGTCVTDALSLEVTDNTAVGQLSADRRLTASRQLSLDDADALILSACVQMPSLDIIDTVERETGLPVLTAATATTYSLLRGLGLPTQIPNAGALLNGSH